MGDGERAERAASRRRGEGSFEDRRYLTCTLQYERPHDDDLIPRRDRLLVNQQFVHPLRFYLCSKEKDLLSVDTSKDTPRSPLTIDVQYKYCDIESQDIETWESS